MNPVTQENTVTDTERGVFGDCLRAAVASILDLPLSSVPHYMQIHRDAKEAYRAYQEFIASHGYMAVQMPGRMFMDLIRDTGVDCYHLISVPDHENGVAHSLVGLNGQIVHDPMPGGGQIPGTIDDWHVCVFVKTFVAKHSINHQER